MKRIKTVALFILFFMCLMLPEQEILADVVEDIRIEQILTNMPDIKVYITGKDADAVKNEDVKVCIGDESLKVDKIQSFSDTGEGMQYIFLLDISGSMTEKNFQAAKDALISFQKQVNEKDNCKLLTFGDSVEWVWKGNENDSDRKKELNSILNKDENTQLFGALKQAAGIINVADEQMRSVVIVLTDGKDDILGNVTSNEALEEMQLKGLPVYGMLIGETDKKITDSFGAFVRSSGGQLFLAKADTLEKCFGELKESLKQSQVLYLHAETNLVENRMANVDISFCKQNINLSVKAGFYRWQKDTVSPTVCEISQINPNQIKIKFSEYMIGLDKPENFEFMDGDGKIWVPDSSIAKDEKTAIVTFNKELYTDQYLFTCQNITDKSMEKNPIEDETVIIIEGIEKNPFKDFLLNWGWSIAIIAVSITGIIILVSYHLIKKNKGLIVVDEKLTLASRTGIDVKQHVAVNKIQGIQLTLKIKTKGTDEAVVVRDFVDSIIVGRAQECDLCIEDYRMSRQHFALEYENGMVLITDLESKNGTAVNGVCIKKRQKLFKEDVITAGNTRLSVNWK